MLRSFRKKTGFTLVEVTVSIGIMMLILVIVFRGQATYTENIALRSIADEIELNIRQAQVYGISVREFSPGASEFNVSYGLSFDTTSSGTNNAYLLFADRGVKNQIYDSGWNCPVGGSSECLEKISLSRSMTISSLCYIQTSGAESCTLGRADITFTRPDTVAIVKLFNTSGGLITVDSLKGIRIRLASPSNYTKSVIVYVTGQISIQ
jgi:Tfp pilus assembly protein FimT